MSFNQQNKIHIIFLSILSILLSLPGISMAEERSHISIGLETGLSFPQNPSSFSSGHKTATPMGGRIKFDLNDTWSVAARVTNHSFARKSNDAEKIDVDSIVGTGYYHFWRKERHRTYGLFSLGYARAKRRYLDLTRSNTNNTFGFGGGWEVDITKLHSFTFELGVDQLLEATFGGHGARYYGFRLGFHFFLPESWVHRRLKEPLQFREIKPGVVLEKKPKNKRKEAQKELDQIQKDIADKKVPAIHFESNKAVLKPGSFETLDIVGAILQRYPNLKVRIVGHTDSAGSEKHNQKLSEDRAASVRMYLLDNFGFSEKVLSSAGYGEHMPIATNETPEGRSINRRVEFEILE